MTKRVCILLFLCGALVACTREDPVGDKKGDVRLEANSPVDYLHAWKAAEDDLRQNPSSNAALFNRALVLEKLGLRKEAVAAWDAVVRRDELDWTRRAREHRDALNNVSDPQWTREQLHDALRRGDRAAMTRIVRAIPYDASLEFEESNLLDVPASRMFAEILGDPYAMAIVNAVKHTKDREALEKGLAAFRQARTLRRDLDINGATASYERAAAMLERAGNPLSLAARFEVAAQRFSNFENVLPLVEVLLPVAIQQKSMSLSTRVQTLRAIALESQARYLEAQDDYARALELAKNDPTATVTILTRRSPNYLTFGRPDRAFADAHRAVTLLPGVVNLNARHQAYGTAAAAAQALQFSEIALHYQNAAVEVSGNGVLNAAAGQVGRAKGHLAIALQKRADILVALGRDSEAQRDLQQANDLAEAAHDRVRDLLKLRLNEVQGQALLNRDPAGAVAAFTNAIELATAKDSTYRAVLYFKRGVARQKAGHVNADDDIATALEILRQEAALLRNRAKRGDYEDLWTPYFSRFQSMYREMVESRLAENDVEGAFVYAEQARAFEPMQLLLQSDSGFRKVNTVRDLRTHLAALPDDTLILQYLVFPDKSYVWLLTRGNIEMLRLPAGRDDIQRWIRQILDDARTESESRSETSGLSAAYALFRDALARPAATGRERFVIVPDGPMHALPFAGLRGTAKEKRLIERGSLAVAGSTSLYLYALHRDTQLATDRRITVLVAGDPKNDKRHPLPYAREEVQQLGREYSGATTLIGEQTTTNNFLESARNATIVHFAGHGIPSPQSPWNSMLLMTPSENDSGELTAESLMARLAPPTRTRLVVLGACSTAPGDLVGPEGVAPLVRPFIAAKVPGVVSTLWDVNDATAKQLLVSLHCHYRNGDDVAVALRHAQLDMLREPATKWAAYQVVGYAGSPYARDVGMEKTHSERVCSEDSLHRPDGLRPQ